MHMIFFKNILAAAQYHWPVKILFDIQYSSMLTLAAFLLSFQKYFNVRNFKLKCFISSIQ